MFDTDKAYRFYSNNSALAATVQSEFRALADFLNRALPEGREKALAQTNLEQAWHWADRAAGE